MCFGHTKILHDFPSCYRFKMMARSPKALSPYIYGHSPASNHGKIDLSAFGYLEFDCSNRYDTACTRLVARVVENFVSFSLLSLPTIYCLKFLCMERPAFICMSLIRFV